MKGIEIKEAFFNNHLDLFEELFKEDIHKIAFGFIGEGSENYGFDDEVSKDHDFDEGFCIWIPDNLYDEYGFSASRLYHNIKKEYSKNNSKSTYYNKHKDGVFSFSEFFTFILGSKMDSDFAYLYTPEYLLSILSHGKIFKDDNKLFTNERQRIISGMKTDVWKQKICASLGMMAQYGQYNFTRMINHGEEEGASMVFNDFLKETIHFVFLINRVYTPFYKWQCRMLKNLDNYKELGKYILNTYLENLSLSNKQDRIDKIISMIIDCLKISGLSSLDSEFLEEHAFNIKSSMENQQIKKLHIMEC